MVEGISDGQKSCQASWYKDVTASEPGHPRLLVPLECSLKLNEAQERDAVAGFLWLGC